jgi:hypothetical protein
MSQDHVLKSLEPLFKRAEREHKWFYLMGDPDQAVMFSPEELRQLHWRGEYIFGPDRWVLVDPPKGGRRPQSGGHVQ